MYCKCNTWIHPNAQFHLHTHTHTQQFTFNQLQTEFTHKSDGLTKAIISHQGDGPQVFPHGDFLRTTLIHGELGLNIYVPVTKEHFKHQFYATCDIWISSCGTKCELISGSGTKHRYLTSSLNQLQILHFPEQNKIHLITSKNLIYNTGQASPLCF